VVSWLLEREYRQHRALDAELPVTYTKWLASLDKRLRQEADETNRRIIKVVIHPAEIETWARREGHEVNERARSDYAALMWRTETSRRLAGRNKAATGATGEPALRTDLAAAVTSSRHKAEEDELTWVHLVAS
jgi:hypothetical protein